MSTLVEITPPLQHGNPTEVTRQQIVHAALTAGRRHFGAAGASLTHHVDNPNQPTEFSRGAIKAGIRGEQATSQAIQKWMQAHPSAVLIDSVHIKNNNTLLPDEDKPETDHVLIIGNHVILIDSKRWKSKRKYSVNDKGTILRNGRTFPGGKVHARQATYLWSKHLGGSVKVNSIVCISSSQVYAEYRKDWPKIGFQLVTLEQLTKALDYQAKRIGSVNTIRTDLVATVASSCIKPYMRFEEFFNKNANITK